MATQNKQPGLFATAGQRRSEIAQGDYNSAASLLTPEGIVGNIGMGAASITRELSGRTDPRVEFANYMSTLDPNNVQDVAAAAQQANAMGLTDIALEASDRVRKLTPLQHEVVQVGDKKSLMSVNPWTGEREDVVSGNAPKDYSQFELIKTINVGGKEYGVAGQRDKNSNEIINRTLVEGPDLDKLGGGGGSGGTKGKPGLLNQTERDIVDLRLGEWIENSGRVIAGDDADQAREMIGQRALEIMADPAYNKPDFESAAGIAAAEVMNSAEGKDKPWLSQALDMVPFVETAEHVQVRNPSEILGEATKLLENNAGNLSRNQVQWLEFARNNPQDPQSRQALKEIREAL